MCQESIELTEREVNKIVDLYMPDSAVISKEIGRMARVNTGHNSGLYALTRPYTKDGSQYYDMFLALLEYGTLYINSQKRVCKEQHATNYMSVCAMYNIIAQARAIGLLTVSNGNFSKTPELDEYVYWTLSAKRFHEAALNGKINKINVDEEIDYYFGGVTNHFGNYDDKVKRLSDEISNAYCILRDSDVRNELGANSELSHKKKAVKMFKTKYTKHEIKDMLNDGTIRNTFNLVLKLYNSANKNCFSINNSDNTLELFSYMNFNIDSNDAVINIVN